MFLPSQASLCRNTRTPEVLLICGRRDYRHSLNAGCVDITQSPLSREQILLAAPPRGKATQMKSEFHFQPAAFLGKISGYFSEPFPLRMTRLNLSRHGVRRGGSEAPSHRSVRIWGDQLLEASRYLVQLWIALFPLCFISPVKKKIPASHAQSSFSLKLEMVPSLNVSKCLTSRKEHQTPQNTLNVRLCVAVFTVIDWQLLP